MEESAKETVIIVHGTWAAPEPGRSRWYHAVGSAPAAEAFTAKLNAALQERGSSARCWAHCGQGNQIFQWSGENSWIARTRAASALGDYVARLQNEGWQCHIVAHSHGGNIVADSLPKILSVPSGNTRLGKIVTLGTPFMDVMSPVEARIRRRDEVLKFITPVVVGAPILFYALLNTGRWFEHSMYGQFIMWLGEDQVITVLILLLFGLLLGSWFRHKKGHDKPSRLSEINGINRIEPKLLVIGSLNDEVWQILHHMRFIENPLAPKTHWFRYLLLTGRSKIAQSAEVSKIHGAKSLEDLAPRR